MVKQIHPFTAVLATVVCALALSGCAAREEILSGERLDLRAPLDGTAGTLAPANLAPANLSQPISLPAAVANADWPRRGGSVTHSALAAAPVPLWAVPIGEGTGRKQAISAEPVVADGRIFTLDAAATVAATGSNGTRLWSRDLTPPGDSAGEASGGGLALDGARLYVTSGFGAVTALDAGSGTTLWTQSLDAPVTAAPTVSGGLVYVVAANSTAMAIDADTGKIVWQLQGTPGSSGMFGGAGPLLTDRLAILPFPSGELRGVLKETGLQVWLANIGGKRPGRAYTGNSDIVGDPVLVGGTLFAGNQSGHMAALDAGSGERLWDAGEGTYGGALPVGGSLFLVSDASELVRLDAGTGATIWAVPLPEFTTDKAKRLKAVTPHYGPLLAGGRVLLASGDGLVRFFDPASGSLTGTMVIGGAAASDPVVAGAVLYVVTTDGKLRAFR